MTIEYLYYTRINAILIIFQCVKLLDEDEGIVNFLREVVTRDAEFFTKPDKEDLGFITPDMVYPIESPIEEKRGRVEGLKFCNSSINTALSKLLLPTR